MIPFCSYIGHPKISRTQALKEQSPLLKAVKKAGMLSYNASVQKYGGLNLRKTGGS